MEEATLRAKIQAMKNLLEAKKQSGGGAAVGYSGGRAYCRPPGYHAPRKYVRPAAAGPVNRTWTRTPTAPSASASLHVRAGTASANKVWRRADSAPVTSTGATGGGTLRPQTSAGVRALPFNNGNKVWKRTMKVSANKPPRAMGIKRASNSMQLQMLRLGDGEYAKANGGFSLVRAGVKKPTTAAKPTVAAPISRTTNSVSIGGVKYIVENGGKMLKRCSVREINKTVAATKQGSISLVAKSGSANAALFRAKAAVQRARVKRFKASSKMVKARTEYCRFYNRFGKCFCKKKDGCKFIHDSRRVAMCRKFLRNECNDPKCLLSHQHDENKVPVCTLFLRGACTREGCKYRHVKVSETAGICEAFVKGYCAKGAACQLKHELPSKKRKQIHPTTAVSEKKKDQPSSSTGTFASAASAARTTSAASVGASASATTPVLPKPKDDDGGLSIRPNIRFASKHGAGFPSLFEGLHSQRPAAK